MITEKIYIATSWRMAEAAIALARRLRHAGFEVDCFCDDGSDRFVFQFDWSKTDDDAKSVIDDPRVVRAFEEDKKWLDWADTVILLVPAGNSAHLEAGYAKGQGKRVYILGEFPKGNADVMYRFADGLFRTDEFGQLILRLLKD